MFSDGKHVPCSAGVLIILAALTKHPASTKRDWLFDLCLHLLLLLLCLSSAHSRLGERELLFSFYTCLFFLFPTLLSSVPLLPFFLPSPSRGESV